MKQLWGRAKAAIGRLFTGPHAPTAVEDPIVEESTLITPEQSSDQFWEGIKLLDECRLLLARTQEVTQTEVVSASTTLSEDMYSLDVLGETFTFKAISRGELRRAQTAADGNNILFEDLVCKSCTLSVPPGFPGWDECLAGIPMTLAKAILGSSGFLDDGSMEKLEKEAADWAMTQDARFDALITFCHPTITDEDLDSMSPRRWHRLAAKSQLIVAGIYGIDPTTFLDPAAAEKQQNRKPVTGNFRSGPQVDPQAVMSNLPEPRQHGVNSHNVSENRPEGVFSFTR